MTAPTQEWSWHCEADVFEGHPEKIPLGGPSRTEAEHPQPRFGEVKMTEGGPQPVLPAPAGTTTTEAAATKSAATTEPATTAAEILESALSFLG